VAGLLANGSSAQFTGQKGSQSHNPRFYEISSHGSASLAERADLALVIFAWS